MTLTNCETQSAIIAEFNHLERGVIYDLKTRVQNLTFVDGKLKLTVGTHIFEFRPNLTTTPVSLELWIDNVFSVSFS